MCTTQIHTTQQNLRAIRAATQTLKFRGAGQVYSDSRLAKHLGTFISDVYGRPEKTWGSGARHQLFEVLSSFQQPLQNDMAMPACARSLFRAARALSRSNGHRSAFYNSRRGLADVANDDMTLPLKGIKVLDMTRVLAGVSAIRYYFGGEH